MADPIDPYRLSNKAVTVESSAAVPLDDAQPTVLHWSDQPSVAVYHAADPPVKAGCRPRSVDLRQVINAILYIVVTSAQWRMLPKDYPKWQTVYPYYAK